MTYASRIKHPVVPYDASDKSAVREFQREYFGADSRQCNDAFADWLFERNPHRYRDQPVVWVCKRDGMVIGQQAAVPVLLKVGNDEYRASWGIDLMVQREWRLKGVAPALSAAYEGSADILLGLGMSAAAVRAYSRAGWTDMGRLPFFVRPLDARACAQALQRGAGLASVLPDLLVAGSARVMAGISRRIGRCSLEPVSAFDDRANAAWAAAAADYHVLVKRDFTSLRWRFDQFPEPARYTRYYLMCRSHVIGYAVMRSDRWRGHKIARLVDYLAPRRHLGALFALVVDQGRTTGAVAVFIEQLHSDATGLLKTLGCFRVGAATQFMLKAQAAAVGLAGVLNQSGAWLVTRGDSDSDIPADDAGAARPPAAVRQLSVQPAPGPWNA
jgi:hypothetical protein